MEATGIFDSMKAQTLPISFWKRETTRSAESHALSRLLQQQTKSGVCVRPMPCWY